MSKILETDLCRINYSNSLEELANATVNLLQNKIVEYKKLFNIEFDEQIIVNYFDNLEEFREFIYKIRGERESLPKYAKGTYDDGMVNAYIETDTQLKRLYTASHELFHILYMKYILKNDYSKRIVWYDEGMAQFISGEDLCRKCSNSTLWRRWVHVMCKRHGWRDREGKTGTAGREHGLSVYLPGADPEAVY